MNVRSQIAMVFHLDKCIGCHTCSIACKNVWTDRKGAEYMWWNNVETKPGTGFPTAWEDQEKYNGGWELHNGELRLKSTSKTKTVLNIFHHPNMPTMDDYYEPWTYDYQNLFNAPEGPDQPTAVPISTVTGELINIKAGPNWDDDLGGSKIYAANDPNLDGLTAEQQNQLPRWSGWCSSISPDLQPLSEPGLRCGVPSGAIYKRGEDGIVLIDQNRCRGWRACVPACPYKKVYFNWHTGKSEKCILCYPRLETGQARLASILRRAHPLPRCAVYDASKIEEVGKMPADELIEAQRR